MSLDLTTAVFRALADPTRLRLLAMLRRQSLTVAELVRATGLPQPRVSTHLRRLRDADLVCDERDGSSVWYSVPAAGWGPTAEAAWQAMQRTDDPVLVADLRRLSRVIKERELPGQASWADSVAGSMERHYSPGRTWQGLTRGLVGLLSLGRVVDLGSGDGTLAELIAGRAQSVVCVDRSQAVLDAARRRLAHLPNVRLLRADMHRVPLADACADHVLLLASLCYARSPRSVIGEASRLLRPGGRLVLVDLREHPHTDIVARFGHVQAGFDPATLNRWLRDAGLTVEICAPTGRESRPPELEILTAYAFLSPDLPSPPEPA